MIAQGNGSLGDQRPGTRPSSIQEPQRGETKVIKSRNGDATICDALTGLKLLTLSTQGVGRRGSLCPGLTCGGLSGRSIGNPQGDLQYSLTPHAGTPVSLGCHGSDLRVR